MEKCTRNCKIKKLHHISVLLFYSFTWILAISNCSNSTENYSSSSSTTLTSQFTDNFTITNTNVNVTTELSIITRIEGSNSSSNQNLTLKVRESEEDYENEGGGSGSSSGSGASSSGGGEEAESTNAEEAESQPEKGTQTQKPQKLAFPTLRPLSSILSELNQQQEVPQQQYVQLLPQSQGQGLGLGQSRPNSYYGPPPTTEPSSLAVFALQVVPAVNGYVQTLQQVQDIKAWAQSLQERITNPKSLLPNFGSSWKNLDLLGSLQSEQSQSVQTAPSGLAPFNSQYLFAPFKQAQLSPFRPDKLLAPFNKPQASAVTTEEPLEVELSTPSNNTAYDFLSLLKPGEDPAPAPAPTRKPVPIFPALKPAHSEPVPALSPSKFTPVPEREPSKPSQALAPSLLAPLFLPAQLLQQFNPGQILETLTPEQLQILNPFKSPPTPAPTIRITPPTPSTRRPFIYSKTTAKTTTEKPEAPGSSGFFNYPSLTDIFGPFTLPPRPSGIEIVTLGTPIRRKNNVRPPIDDEVEEDSIKLDPEQIPGFLNRFQDNFGSGAGTKARELTTTKRPRTTTKPWSISNLLFFLE